MQIAELKQKIKGAECGIFLFCGEEDYLKRYYLEEYRKAVILDEAFAPFNHLRYEGASPDYGALLDALKSPAMMSDKKLIEWSALDISAMKDKELDAFCAFCLEATQWEGNVLIFTVPMENFDPGTEKRPSKQFSKLSRALSVVSFPLSTDSQLRSWIVRHFAKEGVRLQAGADFALIRLAGHSMSILAKEIDKVCCYAHAHEKEEITEKELEFLVCGNVESDAFSFTSALLDGKYPEAYIYLSDLKRKKTEPYLVLGQIARLYSDVLAVALLGEEGLSPKEISTKLKMHEYKVGLYLKGGRHLGIPKLRRLLSLCVETDEALKLGSSSYVGIERIVAECAARGK